MEARSRWQATFLSGEEDEWLPLLKIGSAGSEIGISRNGGWLVGNTQECVRLGSSTGVEVLCILEQGPNDVMGALTALLREHTLDEEDAEFPAWVAIETGLSGGSEYWAKLALDWLEIVRPTRKILEMLPAVADARWASQGTRHRARKLLRRFSDGADGRGRQGP